jgi:hypothetical protein
MSGRARGVAVVVILGGLSIGVATASLRPAPAQAQSSDSSSGQIQNQPLAPPPGISGNTLIGPDTAGTDSASPGAPAVPEAPSSAGAPSVAAPSQWVPQQQAQLTVLDKIYGSATTVSAKVAF